MTANINDKITSTTTAVGTRPRTTTVSTLRSGGGTTLSCDDLTGWPTDSAVHFVTYQVDGSGKIVEGSQSDWKGIVSGSDINSLTLTGGTDGGNSVGDYVEMLPTAAWGKDLYDALTAVLNQLDGSLLSSIVTTAKINDAAVTPAKRSGGFKVGTISGSTLGTTGNKAVTGVGFTPKMVKFTLIPTTNSSNTTWGLGSMTTSAQYVTAGSVDSGNSKSRYSSTSAAIGWVGAGSSTPSLLASYVSMDSDGFTINVTTAANNFDVAYEAYA